MEFSVVIPVYKRIKLLNDCLESVNNQYLKPQQIIIVNNNNSDVESNLLINLISNFKINSNIKIKVLKSPKNSGAIARNIGVKEVKTDLVAFLDSDVVLDKDYYSKLINYFIEKEDLIAIQGLDKSLYESQINFAKNTNIIYKSLDLFEQFFETSTLFNKQNAFVSPSMAVAHPDVKKNFEVYSEWISTCAGIFKTKIFKKYKFPDQFITYSNNEYLFLSYSLFKNNLGKMIYTSRAKYRDVQTNSGRLDFIPLIYQIEVYDYYIFVKLFDKKPSNLLIFLKSRIGHLIYNILKLIFRGKFSLKDLVLILFSFIYPIINLGSILKGDLFFYEKDFN